MKLDELEQEVKELRKLVELLQEAYELRNKLSTLEKQYPVGPPPVIGPFFPDYSPFYPTIKYLNTPYGTAAHG